MRKVGMLIFLLVLSSGAHAWMDIYAPKLKSIPAKLSVLSRNNIKWFVEDVKSDSEFVSEYSKCNV